MEQEDPRGLQLLSNANDLFFSPLLTVKEYLSVSVKIHFGIGKNDVIFSMILVQLRFVLNNFDVI